MIKRPLKSSGAILATWILVVMANNMIVASASAADITVSNTSSYVGDGFWEWTIFIQGSPDIIQSIKCVEYTLHPTFRDRIQQVCEHGDERFPFALTRNGWGVFEISIKVFFRNGNATPLKHMLRFETSPPEQTLRITVDNSSKKVHDKWWEWTVFLRGSENDLNQVRCVEYTLHPTFPNPIIEVCNKGRDSEAFALRSSGWGTFEIKLRIFLKDGHVLKLTHPLRFQ